MDVHLVLFHRSQLLFLLGLCIAGIAISAVGLAALMQSVNGRNSHQSDGAGE